LSSLQLGNPLAHHSTRHEERIASIVYAIIRDATVYNGQSGVELLLTKLRNFGVEI